jgi:hypothetical protein
MNPTGLPKGLKNTEVEDGVFYPCGTIDDNIIKPILYHIRLQVKR